jgi:carbamoyltransferase
MNRNKWVLGIGASHNGAACLMKDGEIHVAIQEERLSGIKRADVRASLPSLAVNYCLEEAHITPEELDVICCCIASQRRMSDPANDIKTNPALKLTSSGAQAFMITHHFGHAVSAFGTSGFTDAAVLIVDGMGTIVDDLDEAERSTLSDAIPGRYETVSMYDAQGTQFNSLLKYAGGWEDAQEGYTPTLTGGMHPFNSLGTMYSSAAAQIFGNILEAGKVMGLAPYGKPTIPIEEFLVIENDHLRFTNEVVKRFPHRDRYPKSLGEYCDLAASVQRALEVAMMHLVQKLREMSTRDNLAFAGGVALNGITNERIVRESGFKNVYIIPPSEDSGTAIGAAIYGCWQCGESNSYFKLTKDSLGHSYSRVEIQDAIDSTPYLVTEQSDDVVDAAVDLLCQGHMIGWFTGGSELGPRALGQRSILCDARIPGAKDILNSKVKYREDFRPFAPVVLASHAREWFELEGVDPESPFMLRVVPVRADKKKIIPAVVHVDGTGRLQTVREEVNGTYFAVVRKFFDRTGVPILLNTSLNTRGEPVVETPEDALWCLLLSGLDACVFDGFIVTKQEAYTHPLDLVPLLSNSGVQIAPNSRVPSESVAHWQTRWGEVNLAVPIPLPSRYSILLDIMQQVDGTSSGWVILDRVSRKLTLEIAPENFIGLLAQLRRMGTIAFGAERTSQAEMIVSN